MKTAPTKATVSTMVSSTAPAPQLTLKAILLSIILTVILAAANAYVGLFAGITVATAIPAAVISMAVLPLFGRTNILENNIVATGASAGTSISAGAIFTLPALILLHHWTSFDYWWTLAIVGLGGLLGVLFSVPLRRTLIIEQKLRFPEGIAAAEVLKVGANPGVGAKFLGLATVVGGTFKLITSGLRALAAVVAAQIPLVRRSQRAEGRCAGCRRNTPHRARSADGRSAHLHRLVRLAAVCAVLPGGGQLGRRTGDGRDHDCRGLLVFIGQRLHGRFGRVVEQPGLGHYHLHHPVRIAGPHIDGGQKFRHRRGGGGIHRRRGMQRGRRGRRQSAGSQGRAAGRGHTLASTDDALRRRRRERRGHGAGNERPALRLRHRRALASRGQGLARAAGQLGQVGRGRHVRRHLAGRYDRDWRSHRRSDHRI